MTKRIIDIICFWRKKEPINDFSSFFHCSSNSQKKKLLQSVVRDANQDQRDLLKKYEIWKKTA